MSTQGTHDLGPARLAPRPEDAGARARLILVGTGGHGRVVADAAESCGQWDEICFLDDQYPALSHVEDWPVVARWSALASLPFTPRDEFFAAFARDGRARVRVLNELVGWGCRLATVIHPSAVVSKRARIEPGCAVMAGACVNIGARLGRGVIVNTGATVDHECELDEGVHVSPGAHLAGNVNVARYSSIGIGASIRQAIRIGEGVTIGAGAAVVADIPSGSTALGVPARVRDRR